MIIDVRARPPAKEFVTPFKKMGEMMSKGQIADGGRQASARSFPGVVIRSYVEESMELFFQEMEQAGITKVVAVGRIRPTFEIPNDDIAKVVNRYPDKIIGIGGIDPYNQYHQAVAETERCIKELKLKGVCIEPGGNRRPMYWNDPKLYPIYQKCVDLKVPIFFTTGPRQGVTLDHERPVHIEQVAVDFPDLNIVCAHACWPYVDEMIGVAYRRPNIFVSPDKYALFPGGELYIKAADLYMQNQFLFGSAYPYEPLKESVEYLKKAPVKKEVLNKMLYENAAKLFGF